MLADRGQLDRALEVTRDGLLQHQNEPKSLLIELKSIHAELLAAVGNAQEAILQAKELLAWCAAEADADDLHDVALARAKTLIEQQGCCP